MARRIKSPGHELQRLSGAFSGVDLLLEEFQNEQKLPAQNGLQPP